MTAIALLALVLLIVIRCSVDSSIRQQCEQSPKRRRFHRMQQRAHANAAGMVRELDKLGWHKDTHEAEKQELRDHFR